MNKLLLLVLFSVAFSQELNEKYIATSPSTCPLIKCKFNINKANIKNNKWYLTLNILIDRISGGKYINKKANLGKILFQLPTNVANDAANAGAITG